SSLYAIFNSKFTHMNAKEIKTLSNEYLAPKLKEKGWKGNGFNFYKKTNYNIIQIFGIYGTWMGGTLYCETAIHFDFIPDLAGKFDPSKISCASCLIRERLSPNGNGAFQWKIKTKKEENIHSLDRIFNAFEEYGSQFYKDFENFPKPFDLIKPSEFDNNKSVKVLDKYYIMNDIYFIYLLKEINLRMNLPKIAKTFSDIGIEKAKKRIKTEENLKKTIEMLSIKNGV
ncbi:DUF4304 domain-containing protein, partial [Leptospira meyeri]|uniref:DUF4304 domain-containing protein n=1 Tax=Leptospira meyeri TaxID=29508 RepID=UPI001AEFB4C3